MHARKKEEEEEGVGGGGRRGDLSQLGGSIAAVRGGGRGGFGV